MKKRTKWKHLLCLFACKYSTVMWRRNNYHLQKAQGRNNRRLTASVRLLVNDMKDRDIFTTNEDLRHTTEHDLMHLSLLQVKLLYSTRRLANTKNIFGEIVQILTRCANSVLTLDLFLIQRVQHCFLSALPCFNFRKSQQQPLGLHDLHSKQ